METDTVLDGAAHWLIEWWKVNGRSVDPRACADLVRKILTGGEAQPEPPAALKTLQGQAALIAEALLLWRYPLRPIDTMVAFVGNIADVASELSGLVDLRARDAMTTLVLPLIVRRALELEPNLVDLGE